MKHLCLKILLVFTFCVMNLIAVAQPAGRTIELFGFVMILLLIMVWKRLK